MDLSLRCSQPPWLQEPVAEQDSPQCPLVVGRRRRWQLPVLRSSCRNSRSSGIWASSGIATIIVSSTNEKNSKQAMRTLHSAEAWVAHVFEQY